MLPQLLLSTLFLSMVSQSLMDLVGSIFILRAGYLVWKKNETTPPLKEILLSKYFLLFYAWVFWILVSFLFGANNYERLTGRILEFRWILYVFASTYTFKHLQEKHFRVFTYVLAFMCLLSMHIYFVDVDLMTGKDFFKNQFNRVGGFLGDPMTFAHGVGLLGVFLLGYFTRMKTLTNKKVLLAMGIIFLSVVLTMTRGIWVAVFVAGSVYFLIRSWKQFLIFAASVVIVLFAAYNMTVGFKLRIDQAINFRTSIDTERTVLWQTNMYIYNRNPIFGIGYGENKHRLREFYDTLNIPHGQFEGNAHNQYINFLSGTGFIGLAFYLVWVVLGLFWAFHLSKNKTATEQERAFGFGSFLAQIVLVFGGLTESNFEHSKIKTILAFLWAISFYGYYLAHTERQKLKTKE